ncbi:FAD-dependent oxidoreductase [Nocardioides agariphilus]|uniref:FAD-dependent oxidoreductase n=1 Tax=Nocardioides agariphilus TaxID=433664 RepID=A0A930VNL1_9ACTN|nr:FAD-dependent oxidoreductase [Nocardioides agariphilus]
MARPAIVTVDDDQQVSAALARDLRRRYGRDYRIVRASSGEEALEALAELALRDRPVALVAVDQRMPRMTGIEVLAEADARGLAGGAKRVLLTAYADTEVAIQAINEIGLDHYLMKPWDPPEEQLFPVLDDLLGDWHNENPEQTSDVRVVDHRWSDRGHDVKTFLARNHVPYRWFDVEADEEGRRLAELAGAGPGDLPLVLPAEGEPLRAPSNVEIAGALGLRTQAEQPLYDVCIVGGGPAGLASAVYAASEGLSTIVVERHAPGGQAGTSAAIENYLGFPKGLSGADLTQRAMAQVQRFGAEMVLARDVVSLEQRGPVRAVVLDGDPDNPSVIEARAVIVSTGVSYRRLGAEGLDDLTGRGVYYGADASDARQVAGDEVFIVGAANSAGQAALNMAKHAQSVVMLVRAGDLEASMSRYLIDRIEAHPAIEVRTMSEVRSARGDGHLEALTILDRDTGACTDVAATWLFIFIGAAPRTDWLGKDVARDERGYVVTGPDLARADGVPGWPLPARAPYALETSVPGVFAAGDVRFDSMKRVASAVGEGAMAVHLVHRYLATI